MRSLLLGLAALTAAACTQSAVALPPFADGSVPPGLVFEGGAPEASASDAANEAEASAGEGGGDDGGDGATEAGDAATDAPSDGEADGASDAAGKHDGKAKDAGSE